MMKIAVFSDSHGSTEPMCIAIEHFQPDLILHLGDGARDVKQIEALYPLIPLRNVAGNCDFSSNNLPDSLELTLEDVKIFMSHGHRYGVKYGYDTFLNTVYCSGATLGLFGHTHIPFYQDYDGITLFNPGSCGYFDPTYGELILEQGKVQCRHVKIPQD